MPFGNSRQSALGVCASSVCKGQEVPLTPALSLQEWDWSWDIFEPEESTCVRPKLPSSEAHRASAAKPRVARNELPWVNVSITSQLQRSCVSIPQVPFIPFSLVLAEQSSQFVLKTHLAMVLLLMGDVSDDPLQIGLADRKVRITPLPMELG